MTLPPSPFAFTDYLIFSASTNDTHGVVAAARQALLHLARVNGWPEEPYASGVSLIPLAAILRLTRHQVKKSAGLTLEMAHQILITYCWVRPEVSASGQWELAIGVAIVVAYKVLARWDDLSRLRWDEDYCEIHTLYVRFYLDKRKNAQAAGNFVEVARPRDPDLFGAYHVIRRAHSIFRRGHVLPAISAGGRVDTSRYMGYEGYVRHLRACLQHGGMSREEAQKFAGQSARAGAATAAARAGVSPHEICRLAGVRSINWLLAYMRPDFDDRQRVSQDLGL